VNRHVSGRLGSTGFRAGRAGLALLVAALLVAFIGWGCGSTDSTQTAESVLTFPTEVQERAWAWELELRADPDQVVCRLLIPRLNLDLAVAEMIDERVLDKRPGHWPETPLPGLNGCFVVSGHRSTHGSPFLRLDELVPGDSIELILPYGMAEYEVTETLIVGPTDTEVVASRGREELGLVTCHPPGSDEYRLVVRASAVAFTEPQ
jgi:LPXTG-site transpeptidase (sortase) family protein